MVADDWVENLEVDLVPRVPEDELEAVVFLYSGRTVRESRVAAAKGRKGGATGFMVGEPFIHGSTLDHHMYVVTNRHCVEGKAITIRATVETETGPAVAFEDTKDGEWLLSDDFDVAVHLWKSGAETSAAHVSSSLLSHDDMRRINVGAGDEVYTIARFIHQDGGEKNHPIVHSGMVAKLPLDPIRNPHTKKDEYDFLVETYSRGGYSGSPVTLYITPEQPVLTRGRRNIGPQILVLGVMWGHIKTFEPVIDPEIEDDDKSTGTVVGLDTMVAGVVPAWEIMNLINRPDAVAQRKEWEEQMRESKKSSMRAMPQSEAVTDSEDSIDKTKDLVGKLLQVPKDEPED